MKIRKNANLKDANLGKCKSGKMQIWKYANLEKMQIWKSKNLKNTNLEKCKFRKMQNWTNANLEKANLEEWKW